MAEQKTHWKSVVCDPTYLGEADFQPGEEKVLTIDHIKVGVTVQSAEGKSTKAVIYWKEKGVKPMLLNVSISNSIEKVSGSKYIEDWPGTAVQVYIDNNVKAFGSIVSGVRVREHKPRVQQKKPIPPCTDCGGEIRPAMGKNAAWLVAYTMKNYGGVPLCAECAQKRKEAAKATEVQEQAGEQKNPAEGENEGEEVL